MVSGSLGSHGRHIRRPVSGRRGFGEGFVDALADRRRVAVAVTKCTEGPQTFLVVWFEAGECRNVLVVLELPLESDLGNFVSTTDQGVDDRVRGFPPHPRHRGTAAPRHRGTAAQTILLAFQLGHANRRKIKKWLDTLALNSERPRRRTHHRRKTEEPRSWTPAGYLVPAA
ncbi:hypothetical protein ABZ468_02915 [Streptomyces sp. NPDC005708]|uniref:hypothetical protein n=1 Tax=Streptomyces sp. NPDC005708 TaxID=3154564 RepID=UPI0033FB0E5D